MRRSCPRCEYRNSSRSDIGVVESYLRPSASSADRPFERPQHLSDAPRLSGASPRRERGICVEGFADGADARSRLAALAAGDLLEIVKNTFHGKSLRLESLAANDICVETGRPRAPRRSH